MDIRKYLSIKRNINLIYDIKNLKKRFAGMDLLIIMFFINNIITGKYSKTKTTDLVEINLNEKTNEEIFKIMLLYLSNILSHNSKFDASKMTNIIFFINLYVEIKGVENILQFNNLKEIYEKNK